VSAQGPSIGAPARGTAAPAAAILLAGGVGARFGGGKLLHRLPDGTALGVAAWRNLHAAVERCVVIVRSGDEALSAQLRGAGADVRECAHAHLGMGHSLVCGVRALADAPGWIVALADMPRVRPDTIAALARHLAAGARIVVPVYRGRRGHPVAFAAALREELLALHGDTGARTLLERYAAEVERLPVDDPGILQDVDTPADAARLDER
jgi:molybdenum cofactor cytidylyltransferase